MFKYFSGKYMKTTATVVVTRRVVKTATSATALDQGGAPRTSSTCKKRGPRILINWGEPSTTTTGRTGAGESYLLLVDQRILYRFRNVIKNINPYKMYDDAYIFLIFSTFGFWIMKLKITKRWIFQKY